MSRYYTALFRAEDDLLGAVKQCRDERYEIHDAYTPYAVHGLDEAMGLRRSRLTWVCFFAGAAAAAFALWFQTWTSAVDWPLVIGGKDPNSLPAFIPVVFEFTVLTAGLTTMFALFARSRLRPGKAPRLEAPGVTDDVFALVVRQRDANFDDARLRVIFRHFGAERVIERGGDAS